MAKTESATIISDEVIMNQIYYIRGQKVMLDSDLAALYGVETKRLKEQVRRNIERFPEHYMFEITQQETEVSRSQNATLKRGKNLKYLPMVFTEHGVLMLSNILKSKNAINVSMRIIDVFILMKSKLTSHSELRIEIEHIKEKLSHHGKNIELVFQYLDELMEKKEKPRRSIGYKIPKKKEK